jgi:hypothetical protein
MNIEEQIDVKKGFWAAKFHLYLNPIKAGERLPEGAVLFRGQGGGLYYYYPAGKGRHQKQEGPQGEKLREPDNVAPGHGVQAHGYGAMGTHHEVAMPERENVQRPYGEKPPGQAQAPKPDVKDPFKRQLAEERGKQAFGGDVHQDLEKPEIQPKVEGYDTRHARLVEEHRKEDEKLQLEHEARVAARAEVARLRKLEADKARQEDEKLQDQVAERLDAIIPKIQFKTPKLQQYYDSLKDAALDAVIKESDTIVKKHKAILNIVEAVKTGELNEITPELATKLPELEQKEAELFESKNISKTMSVAKTIRELYQTWQIKHGDNAKELTLGKFQTKMFVHQAFTDPGIQHMLTTEIDKVQKLVPDEEVQAAGSNEGKSKVFFKDGTKSAFKASTGEYHGLRAGVPTGTQCKREVLAYQVDKVLGFGMVPPTTYHADLNNDEYKGIGSLQHWVGGKVGVDARKGRDAAPMERYKAQIFDMITGNTDRHNFNYKVEGSKIWLIDNGLCFDEESRNNRCEIYNDGAQFPNELLQNVAANKDTLVDMVFASLGKAAANMTAKRIDYVLRVKKFENGIG